MKSIKIAGLCLVAMFAMSLVASATASAAGPVWEQCTKGAGSGTKWETNECDTISPTTNEWEWKEVNGTEKVETNGTLTLTDTGTILGTSSVTCTGTDIGSIGPGKYDRIETIKVASCKAEKVCESNVTAKPLGIPWQTELFETEGVGGTAKKIRDKITGTTNGEPGWSVTCKTLGGTKTDECKTVTGKEGTPEVTNKQAASNVQITFNSSAGKASCTEGNSTSGEVVGAIQVFTAAYAIRVQ